jgi:uncharacterized protein YeaO (DUF488 family)
MAIRRKRRAQTPAGDAQGAYSSPACYLHEFEPDGAAAPTHGVGIKRIYEAPAAQDGYRVLVDRLWPRGVSRRRAALDAWLKELAPSTALRVWFHRDPQRWPPFARRYRAELRAQTPLLQQLRRRSRQQRVTLLYAARDPQVNHARVLREVLCRAPRERTRRAVRRAPTRSGTRAVVRDRAHPRP